MKTTNKELYEELYFFINITVANIFDLSEKKSSDFFEKNVESGIFTTKINLFQDSNLSHYSIKPYNRGFEFCIVVKEDKIIEFFFRKLMNIQVKIKNNNEELCVISKQLYSFLKEKNKPFEKIIIKKKIDDF